MPSNRLDNNQDNFTSKERAEDARHVQQPKRAEIETENIISNVGGFVSQEQYFFDMLWHKAIPAKQTHEYKVRCLPLSVTSLPFYIIRIWLTGFRFLICLFSPFIL